MNPNNKIVRFSDDEKQELLDAMEAHFQTYLRARSLTPYIQKLEAFELSSNQLGECFLISTAPLYQNCGYSCHIIFETSQFDTPEKYEQYKDIGHWINQSFFIELKCILDSYIRDWSRVMEMVENEQDKKYFMLLRQCRNLFAHSSYRLDYHRYGREQDLKEALDLYNELFGCMGVVGSDLNLSVDYFVIPFYEKLKKLIEDYL